MADKKISDLTENTSPGDNDWIEMETSGGNSRKVKKSNIGTGRKLLATVTAAGGETSILLMNSIPQTYKKLTVEIEGGTTGTNTSVSDNFGLRFNSDSGSNYRWSQSYSYPTTSIGAFGSNSADSLGITTTNMGVSGQKKGFMRAEIPKYASARDWHQAITNSQIYQSNTGFLSWAGGGQWAPAVAAAISRIDVVVSANAFQAGTVIELYGE